MVVRFSNLVPDGIMGCRLTNHSLRIDGAMRSHVADAKHRRWSSNVAGWEAHQVLQGPVKRALTTVYPDNCLQCLLCNQKVKSASALSYPWMASLASPVLQIIQDDMDEFCGTGGYCGMHPGNWLIMAQAGMEVIVLRPWRHDVASFSA